MVRVICLEGVHGAGKTTTIKKLSHLGVPLIHEQKVTKTGTKLDPQGVFSEMKWIVNWFTEMENKFVNQYNKGKKRWIGDNTIIIERSPYSGAFYSKNKYVAIMEICNGIISSYKKKGINIEIVYLRVELEELKKRIKGRLKKEPWRKLVREGDYNHLRDIFTKYEMCKEGLWNFTFEDCFTKRIEKMLL